MGDNRFGGFWRRLWAFATDQVILLLITLPFQGLGQWVFGPASFTRSHPKAWGLHHLGLSPQDLLSGGLMLLVAGLYFTWFHGIFGRTPGKWLLGLKVIQASGGPMTPGVAFLRWTGSLISQLVFCLGYLWVAFDPRKQGWHDKIAATLVIRTGNVRTTARPRPAASEPPPPAAAPPPPPAPAAAVQGPSGPHPAAMAAEPEAASRLSEGTATVAGEVRQDMGTAARPF